MDQMNPIARVAVKARAVGSTIGEGLAGVSLQPSACCSRFWQDELKVGGAEVAVEGEQREVLCFGQCVGEAVAEI
jgi:hypothetical protein